MENKSLDTSDDSPASLPLLPGELLAKIMSFVMASDVPVFLWLFRNLDRTYCFKDLLEGRGDTRYLLEGKGDTRYLFHDHRHHTFPQSQRQHLLDWICVTGTCRRLREYGIPAFFCTKSFVVPPRMLSGLLDGRIRSSSLDMAMDWIRRIVVPVNSVINGTDFMMLPKYHRFTRLSAMTIRALDSQNQILGGTRPEKPWPQETPKELHDLLRQLGLRIEMTKLKLVMMTKKESGVTPLFEDMERCVYPALRTLIQRRAKREAAPP